ncbi:MAG: hypothetical protein GY949_21680, partial [Gammaproteobacteria bacterium]|nr:hypothetical protein [Gammaproteobacteria bacterium]
PTGFETIQEAIDMTPDNGVVLVSPGQYQEGLFVTKPIQLQGWGPNVTTILSALSPSERLQEWRVKANELVNCSAEIGLLPSEFKLFDEWGDPIPPGTEPFGEAQFNNQPNIAAPCGHQPGTGLFAFEEAPGILVAPREGVFDGTSSARIDGFTITGAINSHGIYVNGYANFQEISNNRITGNQGKSGAGGIRVGLVRERAIHPASHHSEYINIHHNDISQNSSLVGPGGGILLTRGADNYRVTNNYVCGNFVAGDGAGIAHFGLSDNGLIADNKVLLNHSFAQPPGLGTNGGGILVAGQGERVIFEPQAPEVVEFVATAGSGNVKVLRNLIQGNNAGSGDGGGLALANLNGQDVLAST